MDVAKVKPEQIIPEINENSVAEVGVESSPVAEVVPSTPTPPPVSSLATNQGSSPDPGSFVTTQDDDKMDAVEVADLTSSGTEKADGDWIGKVKDVIKEDEGQPFKEEADAEALNEDYMKKRFNVDVDAPIEEK